MTTPPGFGVFGDLFSTPDMRAIFSEEAWFARMVDVESALARAEASTGIIPDKAGKEIDVACRSLTLDFARLKTETENTGYPVMPLVRQIASASGESAGYVHWGATTQDIMDTALVLQMRSGLNLLMADTKRLMGALVNLAGAYRDTEMAGRTHLQHALPVTFGFKAANWLAPLTRTLERLHQTRQRTVQLQFCGAVGTLASLGSSGQAVRRALARELDLPVPATGWHTGRDGIAEAASAIGILAGCASKIATDIVLLMQTEVAEAFEPYGEGRGGSSTMPQKRNPMASEYVIAATRNIHALVPVLMGGIVSDHERATGPWHAEWIALPQIFLLGAGALARTAEIIEGLEVDPDRMAVNLASTGGLIMAEPVMMALAGHIGRQEAHDVVEAACRAAITDGVSLAVALKGNKKVSAHLGAEAIDEIMAPRSYSGLAGEFTDTVVAEAKAALREGK